MSERETPADAQRRYARDNEAVAERLEAGGHSEMAGVYRRAAARGPGAYTRRVVRRAVFRGIRRW